MKGRVSIERIAMARQRLAELSELGSGPPGSESQDELETVANESEPGKRLITKAGSTLFRKLWWMRISRFDSAPLRVSEFVIAEAHEIHHDPFRSKRDDRVQMRGNSRRRVQCDRKPDSLEIKFRNAVALQEIVCGVRSIHLETQAAFPKARCQTEIMEHRRRVEKFRIKSQTSMLSSQGAPKIDARGVLKQKVTLGIPNELRCFARQFAVRNSYTENLGYVHGLHSTTSCDVQDRRSALG